MFATQIIAHKGEQRIAVRFKKDQVLIQKVKQFRGARWSSTKKCWHIPDTKAHRKQFGISLYEGHSLSEEVIKKLEHFEQWLKSKRYSESTVKVYLEVTVVFLAFFKDKRVAEINNDDVVFFNNEYILKRKLSSSYQNQFVNGIKLFFETVENRKMVVSLILRPRVEHRLPNVLSKEEVKSILEAPKNLKHRTMLSLIYACGLRSGELLSIKPNDIDGHRMMMRVNQAKGKKDRLVPISKKTIELLRLYYTKYRPKIYLFEGQKKGKPYSSRSLQQVLKQALKICNIKKPATLHWLRHSYATHLLENGTDVRIIQELLGHNSTKTTQIYTHVSRQTIEKVKSPFDDL